MKRLFILLAAAIVLVACSEDIDGKARAFGEKLRFAIEKGDQDGIDKIWHDFDKWYNDLDGDEQEEARRAEMKWLNRLSSRKPTPSRDDDGPSFSPR